MATDNDATSSLPLLPQPGSAYGATASVPSFSTKQASTKLTPKRSSPRRSSPKNSTVVNVAPSSSAQGVVKLNSREAFSARDAEASRRYHEEKRRENEHMSEPGKPHEMHGTGGGGHIKSIIYGGLDGIITTFSTVTSVAGAELSASIILILGIAHLFADGISMGIGDCMSEQAERDFAETERKREIWEMQNNMDMEIDEMVDIYVNRFHMTPTDARSVLETLAKYPDFFLDNMLVWELGLMPPDVEQSPPYVSGLVTFASFACFGSVPLLSYLMIIIPGLSHTHANTQFWLAVGFTLFTLAVLGAVKGYLVDKDHSAWWKSSIMMTLNGSFAAAVAYVMGYLLQRIVGASAAS